MPKPCSLKQNNRSMLQEEINEFLERCKRHIALCALNISYMGERFLSLLSPEEERHLGVEENRHNMNSGNIFISVSNC